jgi:hypothetical protein
MERRLSALEEKILGWNREGQKAGEEMRWFSLADKIFCLGFPGHSWTRLRADEKMRFFGDAIKGCHNQNDPLFVEFLQGTIGLIREFERKYG